MVTKRNGADIMVTNTIVKLTKPIFDHYISIPAPTRDDPNARASYHLRTNITKHDLSTKRFFTTAAQTYAFIRKNGHLITSCSVSRGCPDRIS